MARRLGIRSGDQDKHAGDEHEGGTGADLAKPGALVELGDNPLDGGVEGRLTQDTAQNGDGIEANLHHGEKVARLGLQGQHLFGLAMTFIRHHLQFDFARRGERDLGEGEEHTAANQQHQKEQTIGKTHD